MTFEKYRNVIDTRFDIISIYEDVLDGSRKIFPHYTWLPANGGYDNFRRCVRYLILEKLKLSREKYISSTSSSVNFFKKNKLSGGYFTLFANGIHELTIYSFPEWEINQWELYMVEQGFWTTESGIKAFKWMIEEKLNWTHTDVIENLGVDTFQEFKLYNMLRTVFNDSYYDLLKLAYPDQDWGLVLERIERYNQYKRAKMSISQIIEIKKIYTNGEMKNYEIAEKFGMSKSAISKITSGSTYLGG